MAQHTETTQRDGTEQDTLVRSGLQLREEVANANHNLCRHPDTHGAFSEAVDWSSATRGMRGVCRRAAASKRAPHRRPPPMKSACTNAIAFGHFFDAACE